MSISEIKKLILNNVSFEELIEVYGLQRYDVLRAYYQLLNGEVTSPEIFEIVKESYQSNISFLDITNAQILFVSDQHLGSKEENIYYQELAEDFRKTNNIDIVLNGGDIGDGMLDYHKKYGTVSKQIDHILEVIPKLGGEKYLLAGNHDARYLKKGIDILKLLEEDKTIHGVGYYQAYFKIYDKLISFYHSSKFQHDRTLQKDYSISGHSHLFVSDKDRTRLPTLSDNNPNNELNFITKPGFVLLRTNKVENEVILDFSRYIISKDHYYLAQKKCHKL